MHTPRPDTKAVTTETGYTFVSTFMQPFNVGCVDAESVYELQENMFIEGPIRQMVNLILSGPVSISVYDENDDVVEDVGRRLNRMFSTKECNLNAFTRAAVNDLYHWGIAIANPVWRIEDRELVCTALNRLHPYTFSRYPATIRTNTCTCGRLLKGIYFDTIDRAVHYCQTQGTAVAEIPAKNLFVIRDPACQNPDGDSPIISIVPVARFLGFAWNAFGQQLYRTGAPIMFIRIANPRPETLVNGTVKEGDVSYAQKILQSWGKQTGFTVRDNMEIHTIDVKEGSIARTAIELVAESIQQFISPVGMLGQNGALISGNSDASLRLINNHIYGWITLLKNTLRELPNYYLRHNGYPDTWHADINLPMMSIEDSERKLAIAKLLAETKAGTVNEIRELCGLEGISTDEMDDMTAEWTRLESSA
ncbi:MAG TPA: hypothetical protein O0X27_05340 [Methanocorpusculum sp.]|nr:hypothetical protein [Methanocorpusculum sp.]